METRGAVLLADSEPTQRDATAVALRAAGYRVVLAGDGRDVLERMLRDPPEILVLDSALPRLSGLEVCRQIKESHPDRFVPVILVSARGGVEAKVEGLRVGADDCLTKPYDPIELLARVEAMLRIKRLEDSITSRRRELEAEALTDPLTGLYSFHSFERRFEEEFGRAERQGEPLGLVLCEVDGVRAGRPGESSDNLLFQVAQAILRSVRPIDVAFRFGADAVMIILPATHFAGSLPIVERIWNETHAARAGAGRPVAMGVTIGGAFFPNRDVATRDDLLRCVDLALARARREGAGMVCLYQHQGYLFQPQSG
jgi:diguanylate cyclase (GGDEF)-like protein